MIPRTSLPRAAQRVLRFNYETGEVNGIKFASRDLPGPTTQLAVVARAGTRFQVYPGFAEGLEKFAFKLLDELVDLQTVISSNNQGGHQLHEEVIPIIKLGQKAILGNTNEMAQNSAHGIAFHRGLGTALHPTSSTPITKYLHEEDLKSFSQAAYAKSNFAVVANGASQDELSKWIREFFSDSPAAPPEDLPPIETKPSHYYGGEERIAHDRGNSMILGFPGSGAYTGGHYKPEIAVLSSLLGGQSYIKWSPGFSLLARATRAQTQAHVSTRNISYSDAGLLTISMEGDARHIREASEAVVEILKAISGGDIAKDDIKKAIANAKFRTLEAGQNTGTGLELTGAGLVQSGKPSQIDGIADAIDGVTEEAVKKVMTKRVCGTLSNSGEKDHTHIPSSSDRHPLPHSAYNVFHVESRRFNVFIAELCSVIELMRNSYNRYLAVAARAVRRSLKEQPRLQAERRGEMDLRFAKWTNGRQGDNKSLANANANAMAEGAHDQQQ
ncbi:MAG: hypothetical protein LQ343_008034 [Gyalolechia ehrenbergii]|nr:MAG: hypothetical protein LQ343_008034 [Gyalolechia ehrenbergii]